MTTPPPNPPPNRLRLLLPPTLALLAVAAVLVGAEGAWDADRAYVVSRSLGLELPFRVHSAVLVASALAWWAASAWIARSPERSRRFAGHAAAVRPAVWTALGLGALLLLYAGFDLRKPLFLLPIPLAALALVVPIVWWRSPAPWANGLVLAGGTALACLAIVELGFRTLALERMVPTSEAGFERRIASTWPAPVALEKPPGTFRILGLADSFGYGSVDTNYQYLVERRLRERGLEVELVNVSMYGTGPAEQLDLLRRFGLRYRPDLVLHGVFLGNDFDEDPRTTWVFRNVPVRWPQSFVEYPFRNLLILEWTKDYVAARLEQRRAEREAASSAVPGSATAAPIFPRERFLGIEFEALQSAVPPGNPDGRWDAVARDLDAIYAAVEGAGARYVQVRHPSRYQVEDELFAELTARFGTPPGAFDRTLLDRFLDGWCERRGAICLDLLPAFRAAPGPLYGTNDVHYAPAGNRLAGETLLAFLLERGLVPRGGP